MSRLVSFVVLAALALVPLASAGTAEEPELTDPANDCAVAVGNEYADVVSAWISDETETDFNVNIAINKWSDTLGALVGYTLQFKHQGVQFGAIAVYNGPGQGWSYSNGYVGDDGVNSVEASTGAFAPGSPAVITILFRKDNFPHNDATDNRLVEFTALTGDLKAAFVLFAADEDGTPLIVDCDQGTSDAVYVFQTGGHALHEASPESGAEPTPATPTDEGAAAGGTITRAGSNGSSDTPAPGLLLLVAAALVAVVARRRR